MTNQTKYPEALDDSESVPLVTDLQTPINAQYVNILRSAIFAIQSQLAPNVSGTYASVKARLDAMLSQINNNEIDTLARLAVLQAEIDAIAGGGGGVTPAKIRVYRGSTQTNTLPATNTTVQWSGGSSTLLTATNATLTGGQTSIATTLAGTFQINGQLTISPATGIVSGIVVEVLKNVAVAETIQDNNIFWGVGLNRSFAFRTNLDLLTTDTISIRWRHIGNVSSTTQLVGTDDSTWIALVRTN